MVRSAVLVATCLLILFGIACSAVRIDVQADPGFDFTPCRTWSWLPAPVRTDGPPPDDILRRRVEAAVAEELSRKGLTRVDQGGDLLVALHGNVREKVRITDWGYGYGARPWRYGYGYREITVDEYEEGTLCLDLVDGRTRELVWRGQGTAVVGNMEDRARKAEEAVRRLLAEFPPPAETGR